MSDSCDNSPNTRVINRLSPIDTRVYISDTIDEMNTFITTITSNYKNIGNNPMITIISCEKYDELYIFMLMHDINVETLDFKYDKIIINTNNTKSCYTESKYMTDLYDMIIKIWKKFVYV
jgi:uncharacterized pyridoxamine 5'-phosphate oxidase family protein